MKLVDDVKNAWKWLSVWCMALGGSLQVAWLGFPQELKEALPPMAIQWIAIVLFFLGIWGRLVDQGLKK